MGYSPQETGGSSLYHFQKAWAGFRQFHCADDEKQVAPPTADRHAELSEKYKDV